MKTNAHERMKHLLGESLRPINQTREPARDLWPDLLRRLESGPADTPAAFTRIPWFDWALACGLLAGACFAPVLVPILLYYL